MLEQVNQWLEQWRRPVWEGIYRAQEEACRQLLVEADAAWENYTASGDERLAARLYLEYLKYQVAETFDPEEATAGLTVEAIEYLSIPVTTPLATAMQARVLLMLRCWDHHCGGADLASEEADRLLGLVPAEDIDHQGWSYLAFWAFCVRRADYLEQAYRYFVIQPIDFMVDYSRQRVKVMLGLLKGQCRPGDLEKLIALMPHLKHARWFNGHIKPFCQEAGLWTDELEVRLSARTAALEFGHPQVPPREKLTNYRVNF